MLPCVVYLPPAIAGRAAGSPPLSFSGKGAVRQNLSKQQPASPGDGTICPQYSIQLQLAPPCRGSGIRKLPDAVSLNVCFLPKADMISNLIVHVRYP